MKNIKLRWFAALAWALVFAVYMIVLCNLTKFEQAFHISIAFICVAFAGTELLLVLRGIDERKLLTEYPLYAVCALYYILELALGMAFSLLNVASFEWVFYPQLILLLLAAAAIAVLYAYGRRIQKDDEKMRAMRAGLAALLDKIDCLKQGCENPECLAELEKLYEKVCFCDPVSTPEVAGIESEIAAKIDELSSAGTGDISALRPAVSQIMFAIDRRNKILKNSKN